MRAVAGEIWLWGSLMPKGLSRAWERLHPMLLGLATVVVLWFFGWPLVAIAKQNHWNVTALYDAIFSVSGIYTAFLFTFYSFIATSDKGFLGKAKDSIYYRRTVSFTVSALILGAIVTATSLPMLLIEPGLDSRPERLVIVGWLGLTIWATAEFVRAAYLFVIFARSQNA